MVRICVIALVGLPASGKTTFCQTILQSSIQFNCIHMCYDEMFTFLPQSSEVTFKEERMKVLERIKQTVESIKSNRCLDEGATYSKQSSSEDFVILCDDNNYYAGMRFQIYKICKEHELSFGQIYFPIDLEIALKRNFMRGATSLPSDTIELMDKRLQEPSKKNQWERHTLTIRNSFGLEEIKSFFEMCFDNPLKSIYKDVEFSQPKQNLIHQIDILLRKRIKEHLQRSAGDLKEKAKFLNERRKCILLDVKMEGVTEADLDIDGILGRLLTE